MTDQQWEPVLNAPKDSLLNLPAELRNAIIDLAVPHNESFFISFLPADHEYSVEQCDLPGLLMACRELRNEAHPIFAERNNIKFRLQVRFEDLSSFTANIQNLAATSHVRMSGFAIKIWVDLSSIENVIDPDTIDQLNYQDDPEDAPEDAPEDDPDNVSSDGQDDTPEDESDDTSEDEEPLALTCTCLDENADTISLRLKDNVLRVWVCHSAEECWCRRAQASEELVEHGRTIYEELGEVLNEGKPTNRSEILVDWHVYGRVNGGSVDE